MIRPETANLDLKIRVLKHLAEQANPRQALDQTARVFNLPASRVRDLVERHGYPNPGSMRRALEVLERNLAGAEAGALPKPAPRIATPATVFTEPTAPVKATHDLTKYDVPAKPVAINVHEHVQPKHVSRMLPTDKLLPHPSNPAGRVEDVADLAESIRANGIMAPLVVTPHPNRLGYWLILGGHRRHAAALRLHLAEVPCIERDCSSDVDEQLILMLVDNVQRVDLNSMDKAEAFGVFLDRGLTHGQIETRTGIKVGVIRHYITLLDLDQETRELVRAGHLGVMDAIAGVKKARGDRRRKAGQPQRGRPVQLDPPWFGRRHQLADAVKSTCSHTTRPKIGATGCGECWEQAIRLDEAARWAGEASPS